MVLSVAFSNRSAYFFQSSLYKDLQSKERYFPVTDNLTRSKAYEQQPKK